MNPIIFDVTYQKRTEIDSIKLSPESEFQQLKIMLCGKYKIFDSSKLYIYYKNALLIPIDDTQKLKEIFKSKKIKIEISDQPLLKFVVFMQMWFKCCLSLRKMRRIYLRFLSKAKKAYNA